jgi:hypothetical protein
MVRAAVERDMVHPEFLDESPLEIGNRRRLQLDDIDDGPERHAPRRGAVRRAPRSKTTARTHPWKSFTQRAGPKPRAVYA